MSKFESGAPAYIKRPWVIDADIGRVVTLVRPGRRNEYITARNGGLCHNNPVGPGGPGWLCEASGSDFPCFIGEDCLRPFGGGGIEDETEDETILRAGLPERKGLEVTN